MTDTKKIIEVRWWKIEKVESRPKKEKYCACAVVTVMHNDANAKIDFLASFFPTFTEALAWLKSKIGEEL